MKKLYIISLLSFGLMTIRSHGQTATYSFTFDGVVRSYIQHIPPGYNAANKSSLVINMHGYLTTDVQQQTWSQMDVVADTANFIVVYPQGISNSWNSYSAPNNTGVKDVGFISALIDTMKKKYSIDSTRVYSCGMSNGGYMSYKLACELYGKIAAIASVTGLFADSVEAYCQNSCNIPVMDFHSINDPIVAYTGNATSTTPFLGADSTIKWWVTKNGCPSTPVVTNIPDIDTTDGCTVVKYAYGPCQNSTEVIFYKITGGGHTWPGGGALPLPVALLGKTDNDISASGEIWNFFKRHTLNCYQDGVQENVQVNGFTLFPNPVQDILQLKTTMPKEKKISVLNLLGEKVLYQTMSNEQGALNVSSLRSGIYFLRIESENKSSVVKFVKE